MHQLVIFVLLLFVISGSAFSGCLGKTEIADTVPKEILLGAINSVTGIEAMVGNEHRWAYQQAVNDINAKGGVYVQELGKNLPLRLIVADDESDPAKAAAAAEKLIKQEKVDFVLGTVNTAGNSSAGAIAEKNQKVYVTTTFFTENFADNKFTWVVDSFLSTVDLADSAAGCLDAIPADQRPTRFCVLVGNNPSGQNFGGRAKATLEKYHFSLALYETFTEGSNDFSPSILRMKDAGCDALITFITSTDALTLIRQIKESNYHLKYIWGAKGFWPIEFGETLGTDADYLISDGHWAEALAAPGSKELGAAYRAQFGATKYSVTIGNFYALVQSLAQAIEAAGSLDSTRVRDIYYSGEFVAKSTTEGDLAFDTHGLATFPAVALQWMGGKRMPVWPLTPNVWTLKLIPPWNQR
jgi:branched-chain amino acid transport system substrate-binding protein